MMSAHAYSAQPFSRMPPVPPKGPPARRHPFTNAVNYQQPQQAALDPQDKPNGPASPPLPRQNSKTTPPSPPKIISDKSGRLQFHRVGFLGEGGFARVYEVKDEASTRLACKVVTKSSLKTKKAKTKLYAEIKIHRSLSHPNIVGFQDCFEDEENVYMTLELCPSGSLMDMLRRRRRFTEPEARYFMVQLIGACHYMHTHQVIHRDLKLGNLFLDMNMNVKVGDFGLAALIESPGERKKTICGTPNYIAPEVLFDTANGHSFEVDTWSIGVILYTLIVGRPPFQTKEVKTIYKRIRDNEYDFPEDRTVSHDAQALIQTILTPDPQARPTLHEIVDHDFFAQGIVPGYIPTTAQDTPPNFNHLSRLVSNANLQRLRRVSLLDDDQVSSIAMPKAPSRTTAPANSAAKSITSSIAQQEKEFQKAVQPGSPISVLLSSARQPLLMTTNTNRGESPLFRKLQAAAKDSSMSARAARGSRGLQNIAEEDGGVARERGEELVRKKELESQKARIVAQMAPVREEEHGEARVERENVPPTRREPKGKERARDIPREQYYPAATVAPTLPPAAPVVKLNGFDAAAHVLSLAFDARAAGRVFRDPREDAHLPLPDERVFIVSWVDYCNKYGMGYALTDGSVGVHFNDSTSLILSPDKQHFDCITSRRQGTVYVRKSHTVSAYPEELKSKVYLLKHFERYIMDRLYGEYDYTFEDVARAKGMEWVQKYLRMKHVIVFKLSHDVLQFNFYDHSKLILSSHGLVVTHIDKNYKMTRWTLAEIMTQSLRPTAKVESDQAKFNQRLVDKLKYCKEVLVSIRTANEGGAALGSGHGSGSGSDGMAEDVPMGMGAPTVSVGVSSRTSKMSLR